MTQQTHRQTALITGGAGFIGSNFVQLILAQTQYSVVNLDALTYAGSMDNLDSISGTLEFSERYHFVHGDITDTVLLDELFSRHHFSIVVNFAAETHVDRSIANSAPFIQSNVVGVQCLLDVSRKFGVERFIQISTDEVYGPASDQDCFDESARLLPSSPYSASKAAGDLIVQSYIRTHRFPAIITRCSNNYGPHQHVEKLIPTAILSATSGKPIPLYGDGTARRDWLFVEDHCRAILTILRDGTIGEIYNISSGNELKNIEVAKHILHEVGSDESLIVFVEDRPAHDRRYFIDDQKLRVELGWSPSVDFVGGLRNAIKWYMR